ncbi:MAG: sigma-54-dependent Fis family transcriptional regulator [Ignavibacteriae bacterium]|nr:sigma-54-dependent Fis family transcriptional regulator [Ignavibacteria bacterium]MBI3364015.1 sigma-54-dependent Fis family transcriptional regulator [Ignavibacteriota bacterium]
MDREQFQKQYGIIGASAEIKEIVDIVQQVAPTDITVLITGESGVGKEVIAKAIHATSKRSHKQMISVNAGAIPEGIIESELFGHEKGAFTGAGETRKGYFELADGGTIFLDEIGELPLATQVKFLRVLENGEYMRVGSATPRKCDVRVIAATNKDLEHEVRQGHFRSDLFFRLRSINIRIPLLRERREDVPLFVQDFARQISEKNKIPFGGVTPEAMELLKNYHWPGNVRELRNMVESMLVIERGKVIDASDVRKYVREMGDGNRNLPVYTHKSAEQVERELIYRALLEMKNDIMEIKHLLSHDNGHSIPVNQRFVEAHIDTENHETGDRFLPLDEMERRMIVGALDRFNGNRRLAAKALKISERTLYRKIKEFGLEE